MINFNKKIKKMLLKKLSYLAAESSAFSILNIFRRERIDLQ